MPQVIASIKCMQEEMTARLQSDLERTKRESDALKDKVALTASTFDCCFIIIIIIITTIIIIMIILHRISMSAR